MAIVWYLSSIQFSGKTIVSGVLLKKKPLISSPGASPLRNALMIIGSFFNSAWSNKNIIVQLTDKSLNIKTNENGGFNVSFDFCSDKEVVVFQKNSNEALKIIQNYPIQFNKTDGNISVISDIDETIMVSYTKTKLKRFLTTLFKPSENRKVIPFTQELYNIYKKNNSRFFYVSKSENNLLPTISNFILHNKLPKGKLFLTPYLSFWQLIKSKKDKNFKFKIISSIIKNSPNQKFVLI
jgi:phosphatidate phosphatase APP1